MSHPILPSKFAPKGLHDRRADDKVLTEAELEQHKAEFFARGGKITQLPTGHSKETPKEWANTLGPLTVERNKIKAGHDAQKMSIRPENRRVRNNLGDPGRPPQEYVCKSCGSTDEAERYQKAMQCRDCYRTYWVERYGKGKRPMETI